SATATLSLRPKSIVCLRKGISSEPTAWRCAARQTSVVAASKSVSRRPADNAAPLRDCRKIKGLPQNKVYHSTLSVAARRDRIVPLWVLVVGSDVQVFHLLVADFDPGLVPAFV